MTFLCRQKLQATTTCSRFARATAREWVLSRASRLPASACADGELPAEALLRRRSAIHSAGLASGWGSVNAGWRHLHASLEWWCEECELWRMEMEEAPPAFHRPRPAAPEIGFTNTVHYSISTTTTSPICMLVCPGKYYVFHEGHDRAGLPMIDVDVSLAHRACTPPIAGSGAASTTIGFLDCRCPRCLR